MTDTTITKNLALALMEKAVKKNYYGTPIMYDRTTIVVGKDGEWGFELCVENGKIHVYNIEECKVNKIYPSSEMNKVVAYVWKNI